MDSNITEGSKVKLNISVLRNIENADFEEDNLFFTTDYKDYIMDCKDNVFEVKEITGNPEYRGDIILDDEVLQFITFLECELIVVSK